MSHQTTSASFLYGSVCFFRNFRPSAVPEITGRLRDVTFHTWPRVSCEHFFFGGCGHCSLPQLAWAPVTILDIGSLIALQVVCSLPKRPFKHLNCIVQSVSFCWKSLAQVFTLCHPQLLFGQSGESTGHAQASLCHPCHPKNGS